MLTRRAASAPLACVAVSATPNATVDDGDVTEIAHRIAEHLGDIFRRTARVSDVIGHLGRSEFGIIAPSTAAPGAVRLVERIQEMVIGGASRRATTQIQVRAGYCAVPNFAESSVDAVELLLRAATALRHVKGSESDADHGVRGRAAPLRALNAASTFEAAAVSARFERTGPIDTRVDRPPRVQDRRVAAR